MKIWLRIGLFLCISMQFACMENTSNEESSGVSDDSGKSGDIFPIENSFTMSSETYSAQAAISPAITASTSSRFTASHQISITR